jgi:cobaltochelatase CobT
MRDGWDDGHEAGHIDGRRLAQIVASPAERRLFRIERQEPAVAVVVGFLVDCSGSMKAHAESVAMLVDVFVRALEQAGAASEVLGFTTAAWNGGRALADWQRAGRPRHPGRLNEVRHLVFKDADSPWRCARPGIASLLKPDLYREGVDGEAVDWACRRLAARPEPRRLLIVVSDGCPMDRATELANDAHYLDQHLRDTVARWTGAGQVEISALGVGLDLAPYYPRSRPIDLSPTPERAAWKELLALMRRSPAP